MEEWMKDILEGAGYVLALCVVVSGPILMVGLVIIGLLILARALGLGA